MGVATNRGRAAAVLGIGLPGVVWAQTTLPTSPRPGSGGGPPPPYTLMRWDEDYSFLRDPARRTDLFDPIKYIPLGDDPNNYLSFGGSARYRYELFNNNNFGAGPQDDTGYHLTRAFAHADLHLGPVRGFFQVKTAMEDGRSGGPRATDADEFDVQQAFLDLRLPLGEAGSVTLRGGRQEMVYGAQRLVGPLDWANTRRTFEGGKAIFSFSKTHTLDLFWVRPVIVDKEEPNDGDGNTSFAGVYDQLTFPHFLGDGAKSKLELYGFILNRTGASYPNEGSGDEDRYTLGARFSSAPKPFDLDVEGAYQFGTFAAGNVSAWSVAVDAGYNLAAVTFAPRPFLGFDAASGDRTQGDGDVQTFNQLFPTGHPYFGYIDAIGRQNIVDVHPGVEATLVQDAKFAKKVTLRAEHHWFWRESDADAVYNAAGAVLRNAPDNRESYIGAETDLLLNWQIDRHTAAYFGYSHFFAGDFIQQTGPSGDIDFVYAAVQFTF